ncbi:MAG: calcium/sodium antiporter [Acidobacteriota bacterium]
MLVMSALLVLVGIVGLFWGGEVLVTNAKRLAEHFGMSATAIGLTVVAFATSAPELAAALTANLKGSPDLAVGNAVGSNIANVGLILGSTALFFVLPAARRFIRREVVFMVAVTALMYPVLLTGGRIDRLEGMALFGVLVIFLWRLLKDPDHQQDYGDGEEGEGEAAADSASAWRSSLGVAFGVVLLVAGAQALVIGASEIARAVGISERVIGLTLVAIGTSLPELAASLVAGRRGEIDMVLGNIVGSNIFNLLCILGLTAVVAPLEVTPAVLGADYWMMFATSALLLIFLGARRMLTRPEGLAFSAVYVAYTVYLFL